jgi:RNA polymerase sigma factor for flagellar operon FliA
LVVAHIPLVHTVAHKIGCRLPPHVDTGDLVASGMFGLMDAAHKFDPENGVQFGSYAQHRIRGAMLDHLRAGDWVPRSVRDRGEGHSILSLDRLLASKDREKQTLADILPDPGQADPADVLADKDILDRVRAVTYMLPDREHLVVRLYYWEHWTLKAIGALIGVSEGRVSQLLKVIHARLREFLVLEGVHTFSDV